MSRSLWNLWFYQLTETRRFPGGVWTHPEVRFVGIQHKMRTMLVCLTSRTNIPEAHTDAAQFEVSRSAVNSQNCPHLQCAADRKERTELWAQSFCWSNLAPANLDLLNWHRLMLITTECLQMLLRLKHKNKPDEVISSSLHSFSLLRKTNFYHIRNFSLKYLLVVKALFLLWRHKCLFYL